jgi:predicted nucleic acid-binding protein
MSSLPRKEMSCEALRQKRPLCDDQVISDADADSLAVMKTKKCKTALSFDQDVVLAGAHGGPARSERSRSVVERHTG